MDCGVYGGYEESLLKRREGWNVLNVVVRNKRMKFENWLGELVK